MTLRVNHPVAFLKKNKTGIHVLHLLSQLVVEAVAESLQLIINVSTTSAATASKQKMGCLSKQYLKKRG